MVAVRRAEIWTISGGGYAGKPRPSVIVQDDHFDTESVTLCPFTTDPAQAPLFRLLIEPGAGDGLDAPSRIMVDKITHRVPFPLGLEVGVLDHANVLRLSRAGGLPGHGQQHVPAWSPAPPSPHRARFSAQEIAPGAHRAPPGSARRISRTAGLRCGLSGARRAPRRDLARLAAAPMTVED